VNIDPDPEALAETALLTAGCARALGIEPRVAMLSFSNFGSVEHPFARKVRRATELVKQQAPGLVVDGEMQLATAVDSGVRGQYFPFSDLKADANVLIFPTCNPATWPCTCSGTSPRASSWDPCSWARDSRRT